MSRFYRYAGLQNGGTWVVSLCSRRGDDGRLDGFRTDDNKRVTFMFDGVVGPLRLKPKRLDARSTI